MVKNIKRYILKENSPSRPLYMSGGTYNIKKTDVVAKLTNNIIFADKFQVIGSGYIGTISKYDIKNHFEEIHNTNKEE